MGRTCGAGGRLFALAFAMVFIAVPSFAAAEPGLPGPHGKGAMDGENARVEARLLIDHLVAAPGMPVRVGVHFELDRGWHIYWRNPGEVGLPTRLAWRIEDAEVGPTQAPAPTVFSEGPLTTYGYSGEVLLSNEVVFTPDADGLHPIEVTANFLACRVQCIPGRIELQGEIQVGGDAVPASGETRAAFDRFAASVPVAPGELNIELEPVYSQSAIRSGDTFLAAVLVQNIDLVDVGPTNLRLPVELDLESTFIPDRMDAFEVHVSGTRPHPIATNGFLVNLEGEMFEADLEGAARLRGVLAIRSSEFGLRWVEVDLAIPTAAAGESVTSVDYFWLQAPTQTVGFWDAFVFALLGGLILNLMPCVLPVLAIKTFGIAELAHKERFEVIRHGLAYTAGILSTMFILACVVIGFRAAGTSVGWGFQFQEPAFVVGISVVLMLFALNLLGVFEMGFAATRLGHLGSDRKGFTRSFFEGLLVVVLATPCSAPFLGTAAGFALTKSDGITIGIFLAIGLGLAAPFLIVTWIPGWGKLIPHPGSWMLQIQKGLAFALLATLIWLVWLIERTSGGDGVVALLSLLLVTSFLMWIYGALQSGDRRFFARLVGLSVLVVAAAAILAWPAVVPGSSAKAPSDSATAWLEFDPDAIRAQLAVGRPVFVDFTADWCLTCKVNERFVIQDDRVRSEFERLDVAMFRADWTQRDETIRAELEQFGRGGVPMYLLYAPGSSSEPELLPEILTVDLTVRALRRLEERGPKSIQ